MYRCYFITKAAHPNDTQDIYELLFADNQCLIHKDEEHLQQHINQLNQVCNAYNMKISITKTETMVISKGTTHRINIGNEQLQQVKEFKYLGSIFLDKVGGDSERN
jgi:hypothetical protein